MRLFTDGGYRANVELGAWAYVIYDEFTIVKYGSGIVYNKSNNQLEYMALINGMRNVIEMRCLRVVVTSDSQLMIRQMLGEYQVRSPNIIPLWQQAKRLESLFDSIVFKWSPRETIEVALCDKLCNEAMDAELMLN